MSTVSDAVVDRLMEKATAANSALGSLLGDPEMQGVFSGATEIHNNKEKHVIYDTATGEPRTIPLMYLKAAMRKKRTVTLADGTPRVINAFVVQDPETGQPTSPVPEYKLGSLLCFLHPKHPEREWLTSIGIGTDVVCGDNETAPAAHLPTEFARNLHESKKHPLSYKARAEARERAREQDAIDRQERQIEAMMAMAGRGTEPLAPLVPLVATAFYCEAIGCSRFFDTEQGLAVHKGRDHKE